MEYGRNTGEMKMAGENKIIRMKTFSTATLSTTKLIYWPGIEPGSSGVGVRRLTA